MSASNNPRFGDIEFIKRELRDAAMNAASEISDSSMRHEATNWVKSKSRRKHQLESFLQRMGKELPE